ncbi:MAG: sulfite exporter TauE/SafE family protein [Chlorobi bacterium]|nr:sulfite exporter TauE/SafE family protein [Chlorobiota bacterium]
MSTSQLIILIIVGLASGLLSGVLGVGGGIIVIPALVFILGFSQHQAQGTSLAFMVMPVGILAVWKYWKGGYVDWNFAFVLAFTFFVGAYFGSMLSVNIPDRILKKIFGILMFVVSIKMIFSK